MKSYISLTALATVLLLIFAAIGMTETVAKSQETSVSDFLTPDGAFDLEAALQAGFSGSLDLDGFDVQIDPESGAPTLSPAVNSVEAHPDDVYWAEGFGAEIGPGFDSAVYALCLYHGQLIAGGRFATAGGVTASRVASWNGVRWQALGDGITGGTVAALTIHEGNLIVGGSFTEAGGVAAENVAAWDGLSWSPLASGRPYFVSALASYDGLLYSGGYGESSPRRNYFASWDGSSWTTYFGNEPDYWIHEMIVFDGKLVVGGMFENVAGTPMPGIAAWNGSSWSGFGAGLDGDIMSLGVYNSQLVAGGSVLRGGAPSKARVSIWNGSVWSDLGVPIGSAMQVFSLTVYDGQLIAGGNWGTIGSTWMGSITAWDGTSWTPLADGLFSQVRAVAEYDGVLYAAGTFDYTPYNGDFEYIAAWDGIRWTRPGPTFGITGPDPYVNDMCVCADVLWVGGYFYFETSNGMAKNLAVWDGTVWQGHVNPNFSVSALTVMPAPSWSTSEWLAVGGAFTSYDYGPVNHIFALGIPIPGMPMTYVTDDLSGGTNDRVTALTTYGIDLIVAGDFTNPGNHIATFTPELNMWTPLGSGLDGNVYALTVYDNEVVAGGWFTSAGVPGTGKVAAWDGTSWSSLGGGIVNGGLYALEEYDGNLIAGGNFLNIGGVSASYIASWDGSVWSAMGSGVSSNVNSLTTYNNKLFAGGSFTTAGGVPADHVASWDGTEWSPLGSGTDGSVRCFADYGDGLYVAGAFSRAGDKESSNIGRWDKRGCCIGIRGNANGDGTEFVNITDITYLVQYLFGGGPPPPCQEEGNANGDGTEFVNITDITYLVAYLFGGGPAPPACP